MRTDDLHAAAETRRSSAATTTRPILLSLAERLQRTRRRPTALQGDTVTTTIALGSIGLGILVALACANLGAVGGTFATIVAVAVHRGDQRDVRRARG
jgi:hypothetical protein